MTDLQRHRRLSAIVMADVVGYSLLMNEDEIATLEVIQEIQTDLIFRERVGVDRVVQAWCGGREDR